MLIAAVLGAAAFVAGVTGAWSPCGFSMVDTLGGARATRGGRVVAAGCVTFAVGAVAGGIATFVALSALGAALHARNAGPAVAGAIAAAGLGAAGEAAGVRIVPQIRRQVPEPWRRTMPLPVAAGLYGVLLGLGFTTFVLTWAVWALAAVAVGLGAPLLGLAVGIGFGLGRAAPVVVMAARYERFGERLQVAMCERPRWLRVLRRADAGMLAAVALVLVAGPPARAARPAPSERAAGAPGPAALTPIARGAGPSAAGGDLAWSAPGGAGMLTAGAGAPLALPVRDVAIGGGLLAYVSGPAIEVVARRPAAPGPPAIVARRAATGVSALAVSDRWLVWRDGARGRDRLVAASLAGAGADRVVARAGARQALSRPSLAGGRLVFARNGPARSAIVSVGLARGRARVLVASTLAQLRDPAIDGGRLLYVRADDCRQRLVIAPARPRARAAVLWQTGGTARRDAGHGPGRVPPPGHDASRCPRPVLPRTTRMLTGTALSGADAYVTLLRPAAAAGRASATIARLAARARRSRAWPRADLRAGGPGEAR